MYDKNQVFYLLKGVHIRAERDILVKSNHDWIVNLKYSF